MFICSYDTSDLPRCQPRSGNFFARLGLESKEMTDPQALNCTACRYCVSHCPQELDIPTLLMLYNDLVFSQGGLLVPRAAAALPPEKRPAACVGCGSCAAVCPQQIHIPQALADFARRLEG